MPKHNGPGGKKGKGPNTQKPVKVIKKNTREQYTLEQKYFACMLKKSGKSAKEIAKSLNEKYGITVKSSTLATFYNTKNMKRYEEFGYRDSCMASVETSINKKQRPTIMVDMEFALLSMLKKTLNIGHAVTKSCIKKMGKDIFNRLRALQLYDDGGERLMVLTELSEEHMRTLLSKDKTNCLLCGAEILDGHEALLDHLKEDHGAMADQTGRDETEGSPATKFPFNASDGWVQNFLKRHNMHNVATVGEMGSSDHEGAKTFVDEFRNELIGRGITPRKIVHILMNIDETGIVWKSVPKRTYKMIGTSFRAKKCIKDRVTVLVGTSMGGFKLKPVVIGKARCPRAMLGMDMDNLPVHYYGQSSAWMSREIMEHWFMFHFADEIKAHYGENVNVILTLDNAGCHPPDLNLSNLLGHVEVRYMPANTTPIIQPMDQGVIYTFKKAFMDIYYNKMIEYVIQHPDDDDPMNDFSRSYNMKDCITDIGDAWEKIEEPLIHKCFEKLLCPDEYVKQYNDTHNVNEEWHGLNFRGFDMTDNNTIEAERAGMIKDLVDRLNKKSQDHVWIDSDSVREAIEYNPHEDIGTEELILNGFYTQRLADGMVAADNDNDTGINIPEKALENLKALSNMSISFRPEDFQSKEKAEKAKEYMEGLQVIFREMKDKGKRTASSAAAPAIASTSSAEAASGNLTPPRRTSPRFASPSVSFSFDEENVVHVSLGGDSDGDVADDVLMASTSDHKSSTASANLTPRSASPAPSSVNDVLTASTPDHESSRASAYLTPLRRTSPRSVSPSSVNDVLTASTPDHESSTAARAAAIASAPAIASASATAAAASSGMWLSPPQATSSTEDPMLVAKFTALNSKPVATSSPSPKTPKSTSEKRMRPTRAAAGARQSKGRYTEFKESWSEESMEESSED